MSLSAVPLDFGSFDCRFKPAFGQVFLCLPAEWSDRITLHKVHHKKSQGREPLAIWNSSDFG